MELMNEIKTMTVEQLLVKPGPNYEKRKLPMKMYQLLVTLGRDNLQAKLP